MASRIWITIRLTNGCSPARCRAITWTNADLIPTGPFRTNPSELFSKIRALSFHQMRPKISSAKFPPFCSGLAVLKPLSVCVTSLLDDLLQWALDFHLQSVINWLHPLSMGCSSACSEARFHCQIKRQYYEKSFSLGLQCDCYSGVLLIS